MGGIYRQTVRFVQGWKSSVSGWQLPRVRRRKGNDLVVEDCENNLRLWLLDSGRDSCGCGKSTGDASVCQRQDGLAVKRSRGEVVRMELAQVFGCSSGKRSGARAAKLQAKDAEDT